MTTSQWMDLLTQSILCCAQTPAAADGTLEAVTTRRHYPSSIFKTLGIIYRDEGVRVLFSGVAPRVIWISLGGAVFLGVYEAAKKAMNPSDTGLQTIERRD